MRDFDAKQLLSAIHEARAGGRYVPISPYAPSNASTDLNEYCLWVKPELTSDDDAFLKSWSLIQRELSEHKHTVIAAAALAGGYMSRHRLIEAHYGVINRASTRGLEALSTSALKRLDQLRGPENEQPLVLGGHQFLTRFPFFQPRSLSVLYDNLPSEKLSGGVYAVRLDVESTPAVLINGFHPYQVEHFQNATAVTLAMVVRTEERWKAIRRELCGATNPRNALPSSVRGQLLLRQRDLGVETINSMMNGVHVSAGPVEGVVEISRYLSDFDSAEVVEQGQTLLGQQIRQRFGQDVLSWLISNPEVNWLGQEGSVFDVTEENDATEVLALMGEALEPLNPDVP
jgi:hypothetical protein